VAAPAHPTPMPQRRAGGRARPSDELPLAWRRGSDEWVGIPRAGGRFGEVVAVRARWWSSVRGGGGLCAPTDPATSGAHNAPAKAGSGGREARSGGGEAGSYE
jgi:hypothetical protein